MYAPVSRGLGFVKAHMPVFLPKAQVATRPQFASLPERKKSKCVVTRAQSPPGMPPLTARQIASNQEKEASPPTTSGRKIVFAVDGTVYAEEGLRWVAKHVARKGTPHSLLFFSLHHSTTPNFKSINQSHCISLCPRSGDTVHLAHVICDPRTSATAVGSSGVGTQWSPTRDEAVFTREFLLRLEHEANAMMASRFIPSLQFTGIEHKVELLRMKVHKSAAGIGEVLCNRAAELNADVLIIASHGAGVQADYGSVARWCSEHSAVPTLLLPPEVLKSGAGGGPSSNSLIVAAIDNIDHLKEAFTFALKKVSKAGDNMYVLLVKQIADEESGIALRKELVSSTHRWLEESNIEFSPTLNIAVDVVTEAASDVSAPTVPTPSGSAGASASPAGERLCTYAEDLGARAVVMRQHGRSMMEGMLFGPVTLQVTKNCTRPLVMLSGSSKKMNA